MLADLLATKLFVPPTRKNQVLRTRLVDSLNNAWQQERQLSLVCAPAGYGKTTLITEWLNSMPVKSTWLSLDQNDNDPTRFLTYLIAALGAIDKQIGAGSRAMLLSPQPLPVDVFITALINEIAAVPERFILVLDDYHAIRALPIHQVLASLVDHQPPQMHLVICTREDPPLPLPRLRARGQLMEIRQDDLRFSLEECADFLQRCMGLPLSGEDLIALERRTEGWIAGLLLAALSMQNRDDLSGFIKTFSGSSHYILEYLIEEVFERQLPEEQDFLLKTSILDRMSASLCDAVANRTDSRMWLERMEKSNLFIVPLDQAHSWYRYHHLFSDLLRQRLSLSGIFPENELHRAASQWFEKEGFTPEAIQHSLAAADWGKAAILIQNSAELLLRRGELMTLLGWLKALPGEVIQAHPELARDYGWALTLTGRLSEGNAYLHQAELSAQGNEALLGSILVAFAYNLRAGGDNPKAIEVARRALAILPQEDALSRSLVALTLGLAYWNYGDFKESERAFAECEQAAQKSGNQYARMTALTYLGIIQGVFGHLHHAAELCRQVIRLGGDSPTVAPAHIELGALLYEWNDLDTAVEHLQIGIQQSKLIGNPGILCDGYRTLAIALQGRGEHEAAQEALQQSDQLAESCQVSPLMIMRNSSCHVQIALFQRDLERAQFWAGQVFESTDSSLLYPCLGITPVRIMLAQGEKTKAAVQLDELENLAAQKNCGAGLIEVCTLQALAADDLDEALNYLQNALIMAHSEGYVRTFVDKGEPMRPMLERLKSQGGELKHYILTLLAAFGGARGSPIQQSRVEAISEREIEILRLMADGLSNQQIADRLIISLGTAKSHVHHILEKLESASRTQAVAKARELGLL